MNERSGPSGGLEPAVRLFAGELARTRFFEGGAFLSPTGACGRRVFFAGALTAVWTGDGRVCGRVADPTGTLLLSAGWRESEAAAALQAMEVPAFVAVTGRPVPDDGDGPCLVPETVVLAARQVRDTWVLRTADLTLSRAEAVLAVLSDEGADPDALAAVERYAVTPDALAEILQMVKDALATVQEGDGTGAAPLDARALVVSLLEEAPGRRAAEADLVAAAGERGIGQAEAEAAIEALMAEGECYMPSTGQVRLI